MKFKPLMRLAWLMLLLLLIAMVVFFATGCEILKTRSQQKTDSTTVKKTTEEKTDSTIAGFVKKTDEKSKENYEWWRMIVPSKDTTIINNYTQPIIYEGGRGQREETKATVDSGWFKQMLREFKESNDSTNARLYRLETSKHSETKGLGLWMMVLVVVGVSIAMNILGYTIKNFTITKK